MKKTVQHLVLGIFCLLVSNAGAQAPTYFNSRGIGGGGALFSPSINPGNHNEIYLGCDMSDLFHSTNQGGNWDLVNFSQVQGGHDSYVSFTDSGVLYSVSYPSPNGNDEMLPLKSADGGQTWNVLAGNPYATSPTGPLRLLADYNNANHVMIADYGTIYFSQDGGNTFTQIHTCLNNGAGNHIAGVYFDGDNIYIGTNDGLIFSTNGGTTFSTMAVTGIPGTEYMLSFGGGKKNGVTRFVCLTSASVYAGYQYWSDYSGALAGVYTMDSVNAAWVSKMSGITVGSDYPVFVGMANNDIDTMYLAGGSSIGYPIVMRSVTGGGNWQEVFLTDSNKNVYTGWAGVGGDHQWTFPEVALGFEVCKNDSRIVMYGDFSCAHITTDAGTNWKQQYLSAADQNPEDAFTPTQKKYHGIGLENTSCWQVMWTDSTHLFAGYSDINGINSDDKGLSWKFIPNLTSNSTYRIVQHINGNIYACVSNRHDIYQTTTIYNNTLDTRSGGVYVSSNNGASFSQIKSFGGPVIWIALDPTDTNRLYAAVINSDTTKGGIWKTNNLNAGAGATWTKCHNPPRTQGHSFNINVLRNGDLVVSFSAHKPTSSSAFLASAGVFYSTNGGQTWADRSDNNMKYYTQDVTIDPNDTSQSTWYTSVFSAWGSGVPANSGGLYKTVNKGVSWTQISNLYRVNSCTINPLNPDEMYLSTETDGLWYSNNINTASPAFSLVSAYPFRHPARIFFNPWNPSEMWVTSFGYGMATANTNCNLATPLVTESAGILSSTTASLYQWLLNGSPIPGATSQTYMPSQSGYYSVQIPNGGGCASTSLIDTVTVITTGINAANVGSNISVFPNPAGQQLNIVADGKNDIGLIQIYDLLGKPVMNFNSAGKNEVTLDLGQLSSGIYLLKMGDCFKKFVRE